MLIQRGCLLLKILFFVCAGTLSAGCQAENFTSPEGYHLDKPVTMELGKPLNEISGIYFDEKTGKLLAISDSKKHVFEIDAKNQKLRDFTGDVVPPDSDLEDLAKKGTTLYLLSSKGMIIEVHPERSDSGAIVHYQINLPEPNDFETLYYDPSTNGLIMVCKDCEIDKGQHRQSAFRFDLNKKLFDSTVFYSISKEDVKKQLKDDDAKFDPSAAAIHPLNKRLYILSSAGNLMVVTDTRGHVIESYKLNPDKFPQAEGIAFAPNGGMFISNEGKFGKATLFYFNYHQNKKSHKR